MTDLTHDDALDSLLLLAERIPTRHLENASVVAPLRAVLLYDRNPSRDVALLKRVGRDIGQVLSWSQLDERDGVQRPIIGVLVRPSGGDTLEELAKRLLIGYAAVLRRPESGDEPEVIPADNGDSHPAGQTGVTTEDSQ